MQIMSNDSINQTGTTGLSRDCSCEDFVETDRGVWDVIVHVQLDERAL